jgi:dihydroxyacetone kinase-like predicted kinase
VHELGGVPLNATGPAPAVDALRAALTESCDDVVILPNDMEHLEVARHLESSTVVERLRAEGRRVAVIPTVAQVQGLAALAVHEPTADFDTAVVTMSTAAAHTRQGAVTVAESPTMTMAGRCRPGDVLGVVEGDFVEVGTSAAEVGERVAERLLASGGELVTIVRGADAGDELVTELGARIQARHEGVAVETIDGGQRRYLVLIGVE